MSPNLLSFSNHYCGLTENLELAENYKTEFLNLPLDKTMKKIYLPKCMLGFRSKNYEINEKNYSIVFDVPPYGKKFKHPKIGFDISITEKFYQNFLNDFYEIQKDSNHKIYLKTKYLSKNNPYPNSYNELLEKYDNLNLLIDPYCELDELLNKAKNIFAIPYTSLSRIYDNNKFYFYLPFLYKPLSRYDNNLVIGKKELKKILINT